MKVYNTLTRKKEEFEPIKPGKVSMYVCGPTVYNLIHIGNARPMIIFDTVRRYMEYKGYEVNYVSNFTDVDDKIIKKANEEGVDSAVISERYIEECKKDMQDMNVREATTHPKATEEIGGMLDMINTLLEKDHAYVASDGTVYYKTRSFKEYGKLSHKNLDDLRGGNRELLVSGEEQKQDPLDFVLWKPKKEGEPYWESPWCNGRPGWHIECSVMSKKYLGDEIDIHAGGEDLIFPHHENEIAQSEAANGKPFAKYWLHNAFLNIDNKKMSKSEGNFFTVRDISEKYDLQILRFFMLSAHYRSPLNFSDKLMEAAKNGYERIVTCVSNLNYLLENAKDGAENGQKESDIEAARESAVKSEAADIEEAKGFITKFEEAMDDDFNTADAVAAIFELVKFANTKVSQNSSKEFIEAIKAEIIMLSDICGLIVEKKAEILDSDVESLIQERQEARKAKNFARADEIRDTLLNMGIILEDTREGVKWKRA
ncbi:MAG: cysteine--tRNA ligase [Clostridiales bacterium]|nr:cysteine--tRNA ligase [Clostridiales bacterium]